MSLISIFEQIRDIPYRIPLNETEEDYCCNGKHLLLSKALEECGARVRPRICSFSWSTLALPKRLLSIPHDDMCGHIYLEILLDKKWRVLDATWDSALESILPVNHWDGEHDTQIAVRPQKIFSPHQSAKLARYNSPEENNEDLARNGTFYNGLNEWFESVRTNR